VGQGSLAGAGRAIKHQRVQPIRLKHPPKELAFAQEVFLADEFE